MALSLSYTTRSDILIQNCYFRVVLAEYRHEDQKIKVVGHYFANSNSTVNVDFDEFTIDMPTQSIDSLQGYVYTELKKLSKFENAIDC